MGRSSSDYSVLAEGLHKSFGGKGGQDGKGGTRAHKALDGFDLAVPRGSVYGLLGPNGAGKTTAVRILSTLLRLDGGRALVGGYDVQREARRVRRRIGLTGQNAAVDEIITARQNLEMFGRLFHLGSRRARTRATELLAQFGLTDAADKQPKDFSGGMRRRLDLAASMILAPEVLFLDEPTTGLDPRGRSEVWEAVRALTASGTTVLLTTHYLDEADKLSDRIAVIDRGTNVVDDTPAGLKRAIGGDRIEVVAAEPADLPAVAKTVARVAADGAEPETDTETLRVHAPVRERVAALTDVARALQDAGIAVEDIGLRRPTLDEVFLALTGRPADDPAGPGGTADPTDPTDPTDPNGPNGPTDPKAVAA
ncbi:ATP-binding cassette domain-containing protein [Streptomyces sp. DSM 42041]|uniref:ATP-binding cassette domain-containing protein n=1 Tax=Streptomyces hazeniae TaxID=3075538 RepID=A0ABU2NNU7_9ACTN|nr:ATP-binding cassette domain-containing protein [Streptomyces sp. DSM 42041]MDT0378424.1 ATP-binding cassette domain-containing protein [Streptomyces sp. DSM 42041]